MTIAGITESKTPLGEGVAKKALLVLNKFYPGYIWYVRADCGILDIKCGSIGRASMIRHLTKLDTDDAHFTRDIVRSAGELLERARLRRGMATGELAQSLDGGKKIKWRAPRLMN